MRVMRQRTREHRKSGYSPQEKQSYRLSGITNPLASYTDLIWNKNIHAQLGITNTAPEKTAAVEVGKSSPTRDNSPTASSKKNANAVEPQPTENPEPVKRTPKWYAMIAWAALSFVMLIQGCVGLFVGLTGGDTEPFQHISLFSLIVAAVGGIALVEMLRRLAERPDDEGADRT